MTETQQAEFREVLEALGRGVLADGTTAGDAGTARGLEATLDADLVCLAPANFPCGQDTQGFAANLAELDFLDNATKSD